MVRTLNFVLYQIGWFACVFGAAYSRQWLGIAVAMALIGVHLYLTTDRFHQAQLLITAMGIGIVVDSTLLAFGVYRFPSGSLADWLPPLWMSVLWIQFATTFRYCLDWLSGRYILSGLLGFAGAPIAFLGGERLGAVAFLAPRTTNLLLLGALWAVASMLLIYASDRIHSRSKIAASYRGLEPDPQATADET
jgi:hypothetical protein